MRFPATRRSVLERVRSADPEVRRDAFGDLAAGYWKPSYHYLRLQWRLTAEEAEDAVQAFFAIAFESSTSSATSRRRRSSGRSCGGLSRSLLEIMIPGSIVGLIVGYATQTFGRPRTVQA